MRIAILTLPLHTNYGGILQAYALQTVLERMGHEVKVLCPPPYKAHPWYLMPIVYLKRMVEKWILRKDVSIFYDGYHRPRQHTDRFIRKYIHSYPVSDWSLLEKEFDCYIVGSDQIWRPKYATMFSGIPNAFLAFTEGWDVKRLTYAVSFGTDQWEYSETLAEVCKKLVHNFDDISVREKSGIEICSKHLGADVTHVLDPTLLLSQADYEKLISNTKTRPCEGELMCYILDPNPQTERIIKHYAEKLGLKAYMTNSMVPDAKPNEMIQQPVEQWLRSFKDAKFVITDSFHACVFSILFQKQFYVLINESRGAERIYSLLTSLGLEERIITDLKVTPLMRKIDYSNLNSSLQAQQSWSLSFLTKNIDD